MRLLTILFALYLGLCSVSWGQAALTATELDSALNLAGLNRGDFISDRMWAEDDTFLLPKIREAMQSPLDAYAVSKAFAQVVPSSVADAGRINEMAEFINARCPDVVCRDIDAQLAAAKPTQMDPFEPMLSAFALAEGYRAQAFSKLSPLEQKALLTAAPLWFEDTEISADDSLKGCLNRAFGQATDSLKFITADSVLTLLSRVNRDALSAAAYAFARGLTLTTEAWKTTKSPFSVTMLSGVEGLVLATRETPYGTFVLGGSGPNVYNGDFALIIDLGGDDQYKTCVGGAAAGLGKSLSAVIDLGGNDLYLSLKSVNQGSGVLGIGALVDVSGDDVYRAGSFAQGAAFCGVGLFFDGAGNDVYQAGMLAQGAAVCGVGLFVDGGGRDLYDITKYGQGYASVFAAAALVDNGGNDVYRAGGKDFHVPLRPEDYQSYAQGFAIGYRPRGGGGIALLHDRSGNDFYDAEVYAQGVGYWYSLGCLLDDAGNDAYNATQYSQGAGIHLAAGVLEDSQGDDRYGARFGPGQGGAHDLGVAVLFDHSGDDQYISSGGHGMAINNSAALFFDAAGNDDYHVSELDLGEGGVRDARGFGNLGLFVDGEGRDTYVGDLKGDSAVWFQGLYGVGYDVPRDSVRPREAPVEVAMNPQDTLRTIEDLFKDAASWEVTDNRARVQRARKALAAKGVEAVRWVAAHKMNTLDGLEKRAIIDLFKAMPDSAAPDLLSALEKGDRTTRRNAVGILGEMKYKAAVKPLLNHLRDPANERLRPAILTTLGDLGDPSATAVFMEFASSPVERERIAAMVSLGKIADKRGYVTILNKFADAQSTVRSAAMLAVAAQGPEIVGDLQDVMNDSDAPHLEPFLFAVAKLGQHWQAVDSLKKFTPKLVPLVRKYLEYPDARVQAAALSAAPAVLDSKDLDKAVARLKTSSDPLLKARIRQTLSKKR